MATALQIIDPPAEPIPTGAMVVAEPATGTVVLLDRDKFEPFYEAVAEEARAYKIDLTTAKGREAARSFVFQNITKVRTGLEKQANELTEEWRRNTASVVSARKEITERFKTLAAETLAPLTAWEEAEKVRVAECEATIDRLRAAAVVTDQDTSATVKARGAEVWSTTLDQERFGDLHATAVLAKEQAVGTLRAAMARLKKAEEDAAELERLRTAEAERLERERIEREEREAAERREREARETRERADREAREAEERRVAAEQAEAERIAAAERAAEERARNEERQRHERELAAERQRAEDAERSAREERERAAEAERVRLAEEERVAAEQRQREANRAHRTRVKRAAKEAIMTAGVSEEAAQKIVLMIVAGEVPHVRVEF